MRAAVEAGHPEERAQFFENSDAAAEFLERFVAPGDLLLIKGSRGVNMEKILEAIDAHHQRAALKRRRRSSGPSRRAQLKCSTTSFSTRCVRISAR